MVSSIVSCNELAAEQLVTLKAEVAEISGVKKVHTQYQGTLMKQEVVLRDTSGFIKAVLWDSHVNTLKEKETYIFKNFKVKVYKGDRYLNTPKNEPFEATGTTGFDQPLVEVHETLNATSATIIGNVIGIVEVGKIPSCVNCKKNVAPLPGDELLGKCDGCGSLQLVDACEIQHLVRVLVQSSSDPSEKRKLVFYNQEIQQLKDILQLSLDLQTASERDIMVGILRAEKKIKVTFESLKNRATDVVLA